MRFLRSALVGLAAAVLAVIAWIVVPLIFQLAIPSMSGVGVYAVGFSVNVGVVLLVSLAAFAAGFVWSWRRR